VKKLHFVLLLCAFIFHFALAAWAAPITTDNTQRVYDAVLRLKSLDDLQTLKPLYLTITSRDGLDITLMASPAEIAYLRTAGWRVTVRGRNDQKAVEAEYHTYPTCTSELQQLVIDYPAIASLFSAGTTLGGREVWVLKISDNAAASEPEPALLFESSIHGNEQIGFEVSLAFIHYLLENYGTDEQVTGLVDDMQIFVAPMVNPDGVASNSRYNGNGEDLNRAYPFWWEGYSNWTPENEVGGLMDLARAENFVMGIDYHSGAEVINYNWDSIYTRSPEDDLEQMVSAVYQAQSGYDITNGADWYIADGTAEDWYHGAGGALAVIVEISSAYKPPAAQISTYVEMNLPSMLDWSEVVRRGIWGTVTDEGSGDPVEAAIFVADRLAVYADAEQGDFYRVLEPGTYSLLIWANNYGWNTVNDVVVPDTDHLDLDLTLTPIKGEIAAVRCVVNIRKDANDNPANHSLPQAVLGAPDGSAFSLGVNGWGVFDMGANTPVPTDDGYYLRVTENAADGADGYNVQVAEEWAGPWSALGSGAGTADFSLAPATSATIRYVLIRDDGNGSNAGATPGADIDSIEVAFIPADDDTTPVDDDTTPVDDDTTPTDDDTTPIDDDTTPIDDDTVDDDTVDDDTVDDDTADDDIVDDDTTPADDDTTPADDDTTPTDDDTTPVGDDDTTADDDSTPNDDDASPTDDDTTGGDDDNNDSGSACGC